ncbi:hypothetical protein V8F06_000987 [Rhypophila decipiens]
MDRKTGQDKEPKVFESLQNDPSWREIEETGLINDPRNAVEWEKPCEILPIEEMEIRLEYIRKLEQRLHERQIALQTAYQKWGSRGKSVRIYPFDAATIAGLLVVDLTTLEDSVRFLHPKRTLPVEASRALRLGLLLKIFTENWGVMDEKRARKCFPGDEESELESPRLQRVPGHEACIVSGTSYFDECHIVPYDAIEPKSQPIFEECLRGMMSFVDEDYEKATWDDEVEWYFNIARTFRTDLGISDRRWNLVCLDKQLHGFWGKACFALKSLGIIEAGEPVTEGLTTKHPTNEENQDDTTVHLKLQFHWMPKRINKALLKPEERTKEAILGQFDGYWGNPRDPAPRVAFYRSNGRLLRSGDIIRVAVKRRHCQKMKLAFDVQWALTNICALAGGADVFDEESPHYSDP